ncbi:MAG: FAD-dependent oxidoreductase [Phycisphaerales bacterium]|nr:MAG: FAD-dependent oxidoreductase [Phycisphaerales bacterium]
MSNGQSDALGGLTDTQATLEASRCLMCEDPPCVAACPARVPVKHFIRALRFGCPRRAVNLIRQQNILAGVCGLACPVEELCVGACTGTDLATPVAIGKLQHYAAVTEIRSGREGLAGPGDGRRVAIIGAGPSGLAAAAELARRGHLPTVFEKDRRPGGICTYGAPADRVPQALLTGEIEYIKSLGVEIRTASPIDRNNTIDDLIADGYQAVYVGTGLQRAATPHVPGAELEGVVTWRQLLHRASAFSLGEGDKPTVASQVIVVGGGGVAVDAACTALELGADDVDVVCLEGPHEMPACRDEVDKAWQTGVRFHTRSMPIEVTGANGKVTGLNAIRIRWAEPGRFIPSNADPIEGTEYWLPGATVVFAVGAAPATELADALPGVDVDVTGRIIADVDTGATSRSGVYAGGDAVSGGGTTIVKAIAEGKRAGEAIDAHLRGMTG